MSDAAALAGVAAGAVGVATSVPYARDVLRGTTTPHRGAWLIWSLLELIGIEAQRADGARWSLLPLLTQALGTCVIFALSIRLGSGGLSRAELALMAVAGGGVAGWLTYDEPAIATSCVILADLVGAVMMLPKAWRDPYSETGSTFLLAALSGALTVGAVGSGEATLLAYPLYFTAVNAALAAVILGRRRARTGGALWTAPAYAAGRGRVGR